jgi:hypothetical protein
MATYVAFDRAHGAVKRVHEYTIAARSAAAVSPELMLNGFFPFEQHCFKDDNGTMLYAFRLRDDLRATILDAHVVFSFSCREDADAFDGSHVYSSLTTGTGASVGLQATSWMSVRACEELQQFVDHTTMLAGGPRFDNCAIPGAWCSMVHDDATAVLKQQIQFAYAKAKLGNAMALPFQKRFRLPAAVLFRYSGISLPGFLCVHMWVRIPACARQPGAMHCDFQYVRSRYFEPNHMVPMPGPHTEVLPIPQAPGATLVVPLTAPCFLGSILDCVDVTAAGIVNRCSLKYFPLHVFQLQTHTLLSCVQHLTWEALTCARDGIMLHPVGDYDLVVTTNGSCTTQRIVVATQMYMSLMKANFALCYYMFYHDSADILVSRCANPLALGHLDTGDGRLQVPFWLLRQGFDTAHARGFLHVGFWRLAWMAACVRAASVS